MANKKRKCKWCKEFVEAESGVKVPTGFFCSHDHMMQWVNDRQQRQRQKEQNKSNKGRKQKRRAKVKELRTRTEWYTKLQTLVNQYVRYRDREEPCCTCGNINPNIKYDAGHFHTKKARPDIRFELTNIHKQCSLNCNVHGSGMRNEYEKFIAEKYGSEHVGYLKEVKRPLFEVFPSWQDIETEIIRYRKLLRDVGIKPNV